MSEPSGESQQSEQKGEPAPIPPGQEDTGDWAPELEEGKGKPKPKDQQ